MDYFTYILYSKRIDKFYVGYTGLPLVERLNKHNINHKGYTGKTNDWEVIYFEIFTSKNEAYEREREIKSKKSRKYIEKLIAG